MKLKMSAQTKKDFPTTKIMPGAVGLQGALPPAKPGVAKKECVK